MGAAVQAHGAGDRRLFLLRLDIVALFELDSTVFPAQLRVEYQENGHFFGGVFSAGVFGDYFGGLVSDWLLHKTGNLNIARRNMVTVCMFSHAVVADSAFLLPRCRFSGRMLELGFFLRGTLHRTDVVDPNGYRPEIFRSCKRNDEYRLSLGHNHKSGRRGFHHRQNRELGIALYRFNGTHVLGLYPSF